MFTFDSIVYLAIRYNSSLLLYVSEFFLIISTKLQTGRQTGKQTGRLTEVKSNRSQTEYQTTNRLTEKLDRPTHTAKTEIQCNKQAKCETD